MVDILKMLVDETIDKMPPPSDHLVEQQQNGSTDNDDDNTSRGSHGPIRNNFSNTLLSDKLGQVFDDTVHTVDSDGNPVKNKDGSFRKRRGRKPRTHTDGGEGVGVVDNECHMAAVAAVGTLFVVCQAVGGEDFKPVKDETTGIDEQTYLTSAYYNYFLAAGVVKVSPWVGLAIANMAYVVPRLQMPKTQSRLKQVVSWMGQIFKRKKKKEDE